MREKDVQAPSGKQAFQRGLLRENPVLMHCIGLFPAIVLATSLKSAVIVAVASAVLLIVMEFLTALLLKKLPFWLRIGMYALFSFGLLAGGLAACERFFPNLLGSLSGYLPLLAVNALVVFRCETCAAHHSVRVSLLDAMGASLGYAAVLVLLGFFRELLGSGAILGHTFPAMPKITGMLMPFGGFLMLGFMAAAVKWIHDFRHRGGDELATPIAHVDEEDSSVMEPLVRLFRKEKSNDREASAPKAEKRREKQAHAEKAAEKQARQEKRAEQRAAEKQASEQKRQADEKKRAEQKAAEKRAREEKSLADAKRLEQEAAERQTRKPPEVKKHASEKKKQSPEQKRQPSVKKREPVEKKAVPTPAPLPSPVKKRDDEIESFADVLEALNRRRAEQERREQGADGQDKKEKGERQP